MEVRFWRRSWGCHILHALLNTCSGVDCRRSGSERIMQRGRERATGPSRILINHPGTVRSSLDICKSLKSPSVFCRARHAGLGTTEISIRL
ncbi:hypothetical protein AVEN_122991-1 [Araneus ventricosus]|uniref:Secreted protein n=1 Tax=Araneus ventricosus TaxID=182803 RepID=A0A4Y2CXQ7_ARAVE|nr:hypothetical protein AVEN_122991-1 [Araneus ventricosus]